MTADSFPQGSIRFSPGIFTTHAEIIAAADAVECLARETRCE